MASVDSTGGRRRGRLAVAGVVLAAALAAGGSLPARAAAPMPTSPSMAEGAAMALEDALVLAECLTSVPAIPAAPPLVGRRASSRSAAAAAPRQSERPVPAEDRTTGGSRSIHRADRAPSSVKTPQTISVSGPSSPPKRSSPPSSSSPASDTGGLRPVGRLGQLRDYRAAGSAGGSVAASAGRSDSSSGDWVILPLRGRGHDCLPDEDEEAAGWRS
jgi:hypothetical protein